MESCTTSVAYVTMQPPVQPSPFIIIIIIIIIRIRIITNF